jgi:hypothetical protein
MMSNREVVGLAARVAALGVPARFWGNQVWRRSSMRLNWRALCTLVISQTRGVHLPESTSVDMRRGRISAT